MIIYKIVEWRIIIIMKCKTNYSPYYYLNSRHLNIFGFLDLKLMGNPKKKNNLKLVKAKICY